MDSIAEDGATPESCVDVSRAEQQKSLANDSSSAEEQSRKSRAVSMPKHRYNRDELLALKEVRHSRMKPKKLSKEFELEDGRWDPDKWFFMMDRSADSQPPKLDKPCLRMIRSYVAPDTRRSEYKKCSIPSIEDEAEIVLVPQRNSFNTGCSALRSTKQDQSPPSSHLHREAGRERSQRIGSGRMRSDKLESEAAERRGAAGAGGGMGRHDYDWKEDRGFKRGGDRRDITSRTWNKRDRSSDGVRRGDGRLATGSRSQTEATYRGHGSSAEPEWFTRGPSSRADTIELHGFGMQSDDADDDGVRRLTDSAEVNVIGAGDSVQKTGEADPDRDVSFETKKSLNATNRGSYLPESFSSNASEEPLVSRPDVDPSKTVQASAEPGSDNSKYEHQNEPKSDELDFSDFFKVDGVLSFMDSADEGSSRFKDFFDLQPSNPANDEDGQKSSLLERFPYLHGIVDGQGSSCALPPSPPVFGHQLRVSDEAEEQKRFLQMLEKANLLPADSSFKSGAGPMQRFPDDKQKGYSADLKELLKVSSEPRGQSRHGRTALPSGSKAFLAEELEAGLLNRGGGGGGGGDEAEKPGLHGLSCYPSAPLPIGSKVTILAELEGNLSTAAEGKGSRANDSQDLTAFNQLLGLVQSAGQSVNATGKASRFPNMAVFGSGHVPGLQTAEPKEQFTSVVREEPSSGCPSLALSLAGHQSRVVNRPMIPSNSSPIMFGNQPPTNLMMPLALKSLQGQHSATTVAAAAGDDAAAVAAWFPSALTMNKSQENNISRQNAIVNGTLADSDRKLRKETGKVSPAFMPTAVMRKMASDRTSGRIIAGGGAGEKTNNFVSANSKQLKADGAAVSSAEIGPLHSKPMSFADCDSHLNKTGGYHEEVAATNTVSRAIHGQHGLSSAQDSQLLEMFCRRPVGMSLQPSDRQQLLQQQSFMSSTAGNDNSAVSLPTRSIPLSVPPQQQQQPSARAYSGIPMDSIADQMANNSRWQQSQIASQSLGGQMSYSIGMGHQHPQQQQQPSVPVANPSASLHHQLSSLRLGSSQSVGRPVDADAILHHLQLGSGHLVRSSANQLHHGAATLPAIPPIGRPNALPPVGRPIVKGSGTQSQLNHVTALATIQAMMQQMAQQQQQQQQQQQHVSLAYPAPSHLPLNSFSSGPGAAAAAMNHWKPGGHQADVDIGSVDGLVSGIHSQGSASSSLSNGNYNSMNLSRLHGDILRHPHVQPMSVLPGHKTTVVTVDDLERRFAVRANARLS